MRKQKKYLRIEKSIKIFTKDEQRKISSNGTVYEFLVDRNSIKKEDVFNNIHEYLIAKII